MCLPALGGGRGFSAMMEDMESDPRPAATDDPGVRALDHIVLVSDDVEALVVFYRDVLGMKTIDLEAFRRGDRPFCSVRVDGDTLIDLRPGERTGENLDHFALVIDADVEDLAASGRFDVVGGPVELSGARGTGRGIYVRDPAGNTVELRNYP